MTAFSLLLLVLAAVLHALSNALIKLSRDKLAFTWWMLTASAVIGFPLIFSVGQPPPVGWLQHGQKRPIDAQVSHFRHPS